MKLVSVMKRIHWWWWAGILWIAGYVAVVLPLSGSSPIRRAMIGFDPIPRLVVLLPLLVGLAWLIVVAPRLEARSTRFTERWTGRAKSRLCRVFAWAPTTIFSLLALQFAAVRVLGVNDFGWFEHGYIWWVVGAIVLSIFYGRTMAGAIDRRVRIAAARSEVCYACNYRLTGIAAERCPECGARVIVRSPDEAPVRRPAGHS